MPASVLAQVRRVKNRKHPTFPRSCSSSIIGPRAHLRYWGTQLLPLNQTEVLRCPNLHNEEGAIEIRQVFAAEDVGAEVTPEIRDQEEHGRARASSKRRRRTNSVGNDMRSRQ